MPQMNGITINISPDALKAAQGMDSQGAGNSDADALYRAAERAMDDGDDLAYQILMEQAMAAESLSGGSSNSGSSHVQEEKPLGSLFQKAAKSQFFNSDDILEMRSKENPALGGVTTIGSDDEEFDADVDNGTVPIEKAARTTPREESNNSKGDGSAPRRTPSRISSILHALHAYGGIKDPRNATGRHMQILHATSLQPPIFAILNTRANQIAQFHERNDGDPRKVGWRLRLRDPNTPMTPALRKRMELICDLIEHGGFPRTTDGALRTHPTTGEPGCYDGAGEEKAFGLEQYLWRTTFDLLTFDGAPVRKEPGRVPSLFPVAWCSPADAVRIWPAESVGPYKKTPEIDGSLDTVQWVEVDQRGATGVVREFDWQTMDMLMMRPRLDPMGRGFGISPVEIGLDIAGSLMGGIEFESSYFDKNHIPLAILEVIGQTMKNPIAVENFKRQMQRVGGPEGMWKMVVMPFTSGQNGAGVKVHPMRGSLGGTSELAMIEPWFALLFNILCSIMSINSEEVGWSAMKTGGPSLSQGGQEITLDHSWQKGVVPLAKFQAKALYRQRVQPYDPDNLFFLEFTGLERKNAQTEEELRGKKQGRGFTQNQQRDEDDEERIKLPFFNDLYYSIESRYERANFDSTQEWRKKVDTVYERACWEVFEQKERESTGKELTSVAYLAMRMKYSPWADYPNLPIGNSEAMQALDAQKKTLMALLSPAQQQTPDDSNGNPDDPWGHDESGPEGEPQITAEGNEMNDNNGSTYQDGPDAASQQRMVAQKLPATGGLQGITKSVRGHLCGGEHPTPAQRQSQVSEIEHLESLLRDVPDAPDEDVLRPRANRTSRSYRKEDDDRDDDLYTLSLRELDRRSRR